MRIKIEIQKHKQCVSFGILVKAGDIYHFDLMKTEPEYRRQGFATELYRLASNMVKEGVYTECDDKSSPAAHRHYQAMEKAGLVVRTGNRYRWVYNE